MKIALVGTRGVPARYGGFETCVDEVGRRLVKAGHEVVVYCRTADGEDRPTEYEGMQLVHLPAVRKKSLETLSHTALSVLHQMLRPADAAIVFNAANSPFLPLLRARRIPVATHVDGLEWRRSKWQGAGRAYYRNAESLAVKWSDALIADAQGIADYYRDEFGADTEQIAYGAPLLVDAGRERILEYGLSRRGYHLVVARFEPENHVHTIVEGYRRSSATKPLVVVGSAPYADEYTRRLHELADDRVRFLGGVWDQDLLDELYANSATYLHGHSVGGTNPSLLRAMGSAAPTIALDVVFNREVLTGTGRYFRDAEGVRAEIERAEARPSETIARGLASQVAARRYDWDDVADKYEALCRRLASRELRRGPRGVRPTGRRNGIVVAPPATGDAPKAASVSWSPDAVADESVMPKAG
ncbi:glycosyltransferase family protein [Jatrophihabitans fulvus]